MISLNLEIPGSVAAPYFTAAEKINSRLPGANPKLDAKQLMVFAVSGHESDDLCARFDLALRLVSTVASTEHEAPPPDVSLHVMLDIPDLVAAQYYEAAVILNSRLPGASTRLDAKRLLVFALAGHDTENLCERFDLALRLVRRTPPAAFNPVLEDEFGRDDRPVLRRPAREEAA